VNTQTEHGCSIIHEQGARRREAGSLRLRFLEDYVVFDFHITSFLMQLNKKRRKPRWDSFFLFHVSFLFMAASQWTQTFVFFFIGLVLLLAFFEVDVAIFRYEYRYGNVLRCERQHV
jgi:hypothetical protein